MKNKKYLYTYRIADIVFSIFSKNEIRTTENFFPFIYQGEKKDFIIQLEEKESIPFEMNNVLFEHFLIFSILFTCHFTSFYYTFMRDYAHSTNNYLY